MWEVIINIAVVVVGVGLLSFLAWTIDRQDKYDEEHIDLNYGDDEEL